MPNTHLKINISKTTKAIIDTLQNSGYEAYVVGGCVRDSLLGRKPDDWDITTSAPPEETMKIFKLNYKVIPTGLKHGTVTLIGEDNQPYEVTTYRIDGEYSDGRHPDEVHFTVSLKEDLSRRDFTVNAMAYNDNSGLMDYFNGLTDLENKVIRCVRDANKRFNEDALRMMRAVRFSAQLGFGIDKETEDAISNNSALIQNVSIERIQQEFNKIIVNDPMKIHYLWKLGLLDYFLPEYNSCVGVKQNNPYHIYDVNMHLLESMDHIENRLDLRLTMLLHDICKPQCRTTDENGRDHFYNHGELGAQKSREILRRLKYDNNTIDKVSTLIKYHDTDANGKRSIRRLLNKIGEENFRDLMKVKEADALAQNPIYYEERHKWLENIKKEYDEIIFEKNCFSLKDLKINGRDLLDMGYKPDKSIKETLNWLLEQVIDEPELNKRENLIDMIKGYKVP